MRTKIKGKVTEIVLQVNTCFANGKEVMWEDEIVRDDKEKRDTFKLGTKVKYIYPVVIYLTHSEVEIQCDLIRHCYCTMEVQLSF